MTEPRRRGPPIALAPVPAWLRELAEMEVERAAAWRYASSVCVSAAGRNGAPLVFELFERADHTLGCHRVTSGATGRLVRAPHARLATMSAARRAELHRFVLRFRWLDARLHRGPANARYEPSEREARVLSVCSALTALREPDDALRLAFRDERASDPALRDVGLYLDIVAGRWELVFTRATHEPAWLAPTLRGIAGDVDAARALAAETSIALDARALASVSGLAFDLLGLHDAALAAFERGVESLLGSERADLSLELAKLCRSRGADRDALSWARRALSSCGRDDDRLRRVCAELVRIGALHEAHVALEERCAREPLDPALALDLAELLLWAGRAREARPWLERTEGSGEARWLRCAGVLAALEGRWLDARGAFTRAHERAPRDAEIAAWLAEIHLRQGDRARAEEHLLASRTRSQSAVHVVLGAALHGDAESRSEMVALAEALGEPADRWRRRRGRSPDEERAALALLRRFGGNRGDPLTARSSVATGGLGLALFRLPVTDTMLSSRDASADALRRLGTTPLESTEGELEALAATYPGSPHPLCYHGELNLWLGRYERAIALFDEALERRPARWGYVGKAAALILLGDHARADAAIAACDTHFAPLAGATTHVYVGEDRRRRRDYAAAREHLTIAVRAKPGRAAAWMNLALTHLALGERPEAERIFDALTAELPRLFFDAWLAESGERTWPPPRREMPRLFERALAMMRGNRSSHLITYFDADGAFRIAQPMSRWRPALAKHARYVALDLRTRLAVGLDASET